jgi:ABC-type multidrug transport system ATPase subunit
MAKQFLRIFHFPFTKNKLWLLWGKIRSGKSTMLKMIGGFIKPDSGKISKYKAPLNVGYVPEVVPVDIPFTLDEYLSYMGKIRGMKKDPLHQRINDLLELFHMQKVNGLRMSHFSKGIRQKAITLLHCRRSRDYYIALFIICALIGLCLSLVSVFIR